MQDARTDWLGDHTVEQLKDLARSVGLAVGGVKADLVDRLDEYMDRHGLASPWTKGINTGGAAPAGTLMVHDGTGNARPAADDQAGDAETDDEVVYSFPTRVRCPRCHGVNTVRGGQRGQVQYRNCRTPVCRHTFKVIGRRI